MWLSPSTPTLYREGLLTTAQETTFKKSPLKHAQMLTSAFVPSYSVWLGGSGPPHPEEVEFSPIEEHPPSPTHIAFEFTGALQAPIILA